MADEINLEISLETDKALKDLSKFQSGINKELGAVEKSLTGLKSVGAGIAAAVSAGFAAFKIAEFLKEGIDAAAEAEVAVSKLANQLRLSGSFSEEALKSFTDLASEIERTTNVSEELVLEQIGIAKAFGLSNEQAEKLVKAAVELSAVTGDTLDTSVQQLIKSYNGQTKALESTIGEVKGLTKEQVLAGGAIDLIADKLKGTAANAANTYTGAILNLGRAFGDIAKEFGKTIVSNEKLVTLISSVAKEFDRLTDSVGDNSSALGTLINFTVDALVQVGKAVTKLISWWETLISLPVIFAGIVTSALSQALADVISFFTNAQSEVAGFFRKFGLDTSRFTDEVTKSAVEGSNAGGKLFDSFSRVEKALDGITKGSKKAKEELGKKPPKNPIVDADELNKSLEEYKRFVNDIVLATADETQKVNLKRQEQYDKLDDLRKRALLSDKEYEEQKLKIKESYESQITEINRKESEKRVAEQKKEIDDIKAYAAQAFANPIQYVLEQTGALSVDAKDFNKEFLGTAGAIGGLISSAISGEEGAKKLASQLGSGFLDVFVPGLGTALGPLITQLTASPEELKKNLDAFLNAFPEVLVNLITNLPGILELIAKKVFTLNVFKNLAIGLTEAIVQGLIDSNKALFVGFYDIAKQTLQFVIGGLVSAVGALFDSKIGELAGKFYTGILNAFTNGANFISNALASIWNNLFKTGLAQFITNFVTSTATVITQFFETLGSGIASGFESARQAISDVVSGIFNSISSAFAQFFTELANFFAPIGEYLAATIGTGIRDGVQFVIDGIVSAFTVVVEAFNTIFQPIVDFIKGIVEKLDSLSKGGKVGEAGSAIKKTGGKIKKALGFAEGGLVPGGFPDDTFPARLTSGELIVPTNLVGALSDFLQSPKTSSDSDMSVTNALLAKLIQKLDQPINVSTTAELNGRALADIILQLNRNNARLAG